VGELATAVHHRIGAVVVVFDNGQYGNVQQMQRHHYGGRVIASDLTNPDFAELAATFGARAVRAGTPDEVGSAIADAAGAELPTVVHVPVGDMPSADRFR
jgi:acetolactate synthase-1/2/3 large subunit